MTDDLTLAHTDAPTAAVFRALAEMLYAAEDYDAVYSLIVEAAPRLIDGCDHASLMLRDGDRLTTVAASDEIAADIDALERELGQGPCLDAIVDDAAYHDADLSLDSPWPVLAEQLLAGTPVRGMAGVRLMTQDGRAGALNLFSDTPGALDEASVDTGIVLGAFVTIALLAAQQKQAATSLKDGLASNREIGKAVGLMMAFHKINDEEAFEMLKSTSQDMNIKLIEVARQVVAHHNRV